METAVLLPQCLTIAGSDSGGGAGIQADLKTFAAHGVYGLTAVTSITAQNTRGITRVFDLPAEVVRAQIASLCDDFEIASAKTGMLGSGEIVRAVADFWRRWNPRPPLIVDPVISSTDGQPLLRPDAVDLLRRELIPLAALVTPNRPEAELLSGIPIRDRESLRQAGRGILDLGASAVLIKGGHLEAGDFDRGQVVDFLLRAGSCREYSAPRIDGPSAHGTGCALSAAICAGLARGLALEEAVGAAKEYVRSAIRRGLAVGHGRRMMDHLFVLRSGSGRAADPGRDSPEEAP